MPRGRLCLRPTRPLPCLCVSRRTLVIGCGACLGNPGRSHPKVFTGITSVKSRPLSERGPVPRPCGRASAGPCGPGQGPGLPGSPAESLSLSAPVSGSRRVRAGGSAHPWAAHGAQSPNTTRKAVTAAPRPAGPATVTAALARLPDPPTSASAWASEFLFFQNGIRSLSVPQNHLGDPVFCVTSCIADKSWGGRGRCCC